MNPCLSEKSRDRSFGAPFLLLVWDRKTDPAPLRCARITRPMAQNLERNYDIRRLATMTLATPRSSRYAFQLAHLNLTMPLEVMPRESIISPTRENIERILRTENKVHVIANLFQRIRLERGGSKRIIRASEITHKYQRSRHQTEKGEDGSRP